MLLCARPNCTRPLPRTSDTNLCWTCATIWNRWCIPVGGYIGSLDLQKVGHRFLSEASPAPAEVTAALRIMRGTRHREGDWAARPAYRLQPLLHGRYPVRLPHLLVGRRKEPSMRSLGMALAHYVLGHTVLGCRGPYCQYLAGGSFYVRKGPLAPKGVEVPTGGTKSAAYFLHRTDYSVIGREVLKACEVLGVYPKSRETSDRITSIYLEGLAAGDYRSPVIVHNGSRPTNAIGDSVFDHYTPTDPIVPRQYRNKLRRASGAIGREFPVGLDVTLEEYLEARRAAQRASADLFKISTCPAPATDWLGF